MSRTLGYGAFLLGIVLIVGAALYRIAESNPDGPPPPAAQDQQAIRVATLIIMIGGVIAAAGALAAYLIGRLPPPNADRKDEGQADPGG
jgi:hypothetical protein